MHIKGVETWHVRQRRGGMECDTEEGGQGMHPASVLNQMSPHDKCSHTVAWFVTFLYFDYVLDSREVMRRYPLSFVPAQLVTLS